MTTPNLILLTYLSPNIDRYEQDFRSMNAGDPTAYVVIGQFTYRHSKTKPPLPFLGGSDSPSGAKIHRSLALALTTLFEHYGDIIDDRVTTDTHMDAIIRGGAEYRIGRGQGSKLNYAFSKALVQMMSLFLVFNDHRVRGKEIGCDAPSDDLELAMATNHKCIYNYMRRLFPNPARCDKFFRVNGRVKDFLWSTEEILENTKNMFDKAKNGIVCSWEANIDHPKCLWVHHFVVLQTFHRNLMIVDRTENDELMSELEVRGKFHTFQFFGGEWTDFFTYNDRPNVRGSRISWTGVEQDLEELR